MALPAGTTTVRIYGTYVNSGGKPYAGIVAFRPVVYTTGGDFIIPATNTRVTLTGGTFSIVLPTSDNAELTPDGWTYEVTEMLEGGVYRRYQIIAPHNVAEVEIADLTPLQEVPDTEPIPAPVTYATELILPFTVNTVQVGTGKSKLYNDSGVTRDIIAVRITADTVTGAPLVVDVKKNGSSLWSNPANRPTINPPGGTIKATNMTTTKVEDGSYFTCDVVSADAASALVVQVLIR